MDTLAGLSTAARAIYAILVDRIDYHEYIPKPKRSERQRKPDRSKPQPTPEQRARFEAINDQLTKLFAEVDKNPPLADVKPRPKKKRKANGAAQPEATA